MQIARSASVARGVKAQPFGRSGVLAQPRRSSVAPRAIEQSTVAAVTEYTGVAGALYDYLAPQAADFKKLDLPEALIHWGHPGNMMVVLLAMGGYGAGYLGWQIRLSDNAEVVAKAKADHPKIALGMFFFFAAGALGGMTSLLMQDKPIFASPHVWTGLAGLGLLGVQSFLPALFGSQPTLRTAHAYLGSAILALFLVHAGLGLKLGLSL